MSDYNFDAVIERKNTDCVKHDLLNPLFGRDDLIPMWVADMDFSVPSFVAIAIQKRAAHPVYGYSFRSDSYYEAIINWYRERQNWYLEKDWIVFSPGVVPALNMLVMACTRPGDKIIVQPPVYFPFFAAVENHDRKLVYNELKREGNRYYIDFEDLEKKASEGARMLFLCSPHNPVSRVWSREELIQLSAICVKHDILIVSDEIHSDLIFPGHVHVPLASINETIASRTITCVAPSKTFNLAGLSSSSIIIPEKKIRKKFESIVDKVHVGSGNIFGNVASEAAYRQGSEWLNALMNYLDGNFQLMKDYIDENLPLVEMIIPEATYLVWLDFKETGFDSRQLRRFIREEARLALNDGPMFGPGGDGYQRINIACPRSKLILAMEQLKRAFDRIKS
ncbi:MAG: MalY/PatB family protein [Bacteroidales bacterium]